MQTVSNQLVLRKDDYALLISFVNSGNLKNGEELLSELKKAKLVNKESFPEDVVRINSTVRIKAEEKNEILEFMLVMPNKADVKDKKISVMSPVGTALIGFRKGQQVKWQVPFGKRTFTILEVINDEK